MQIRKMADYNLLKVAIPEDTRMSEPTNQKNKLNPRTHRGRRAGGMEPLLGVSDVLQYFETILPLVESL